MQNMRNFFILWDTAPVLASDRVQYVNFPGFSIRFYYRFDLSNGEFRRQIKAFRLILTVILFGVCGYHRGMMEMEEGKLIAIRWGQIKSLYRNGCHTSKWHNKALRNQSCNMDGWIMYGERKMLSSTL